MPDDSLAKPYKGPQSYQSHDAGLFFGREMEAEKLLSKILSSRFSLLHAQSGAGKTSLLNARIIPQLEQRGWLPVRILPQNDPIESTWRSTLQALLPPLETEAKAIKRAVERLAGEGEDLSLDELLRRYDDLPDRSAAKRELIAPMDLDDTVGKQYEQWLGGGQVTPFFCRLLRATSEIRALNDHLRFFMKNPTGDPLTGKTPVSQIFQLCSHSSQLEGYIAMLAKLEAKNSLWGLLEKFENLFEVYSANGISLKLTLIFDQFEEMFTRFVDPGQLKVEIQDIPDWRLRWRFFDELQALYFRGYGDARSADVEGEGLSALPLRYVVSMRSEWISRLDGIARFAPDIVPNAYHLDLLVKETARQAIQEPARQYGFGYENSLYDKIIDDLCKEMRFVEPTHLQIVCEKLWDARGRQLAGGLQQKNNNTDSSLSTPECTLVELEVYQSLDGAAGILKAFLVDYLEGLVKDEKLTAIEMLEPLVTVSGTRNIVDYEQLLHSPFRKAESTLENSSNGSNIIPSLDWSSDCLQRRKNCLANLINRNIVRMENRLGGQFLEITHEFLIDPIRKEVSRELYSDLSRRNFRQALIVLSHCEAMSLGIDMDEDFGQADFRAIIDYSEEIAWSHWACELMLRRAIEYGTGKAVLGKWLERYESLSSSGDAFATALVQLGKIEQEKRFDLTLGFKQIQALNLQREQLTDLSLGIVEVVFKSQLKHAKDAHRADIVYWSRRFYEQQST